MTNIYNAIQNLYHMDKETWQEVLSEMYTLVNNTSLKFDTFEQKFLLHLGNEVTKELKKMYNDGRLGDIINDVLLKDINTKVDNNYTTLDNKIDTVNSELNSQLDTKANVIKFEQFGATGTDDDTITIQKCIDYAISNNKFIQCDIGKVYNVTQITINGFLNIDFNYSTLKAISVQAPLYINKQGNLFSGYLKNLRIDCNLIAEKGIYIYEDWRRVYKDIYIENLAPNGIGIDTTENGLGGCLFDGIRGYGSKSYATTLMVIKSPDSVVKNVDAQNFKYSFDVYGNTIFENIHTYIAWKEIYENSYFIKTNCPIQATNLYPDTQHRCFIFNTIHAITITGITTWFNNEVINPNDFSTPYIFYTENENNLSRVFINNSAFRVPSNGETYKICNISSPRLNLSSCVIAGNITEQGYKGFVISLNPTIFKSNLQHRNNGDTLLFGGYYDVTSTTGVTGEIGLFSIANDISHRFLNTRYFIPYGYMSGNNFIYEGELQCIVKNNADIYIVPRVEMNGKRFYIQGIIAYRESKNVVS